MQSFIKLSAAIYELSC